MNEIEFIAQFLVLLCATTTGFVNGRIMCASLNRVAAGLG